MIKNYVKLSIAVVRFVEKIEVFKNFFYTCRVPRPIFHKVIFCFKSWAPSNFILSDTFPIFFWGGKLKNKYISYRELGNLGSSKRPFWPKRTFLKWKFGRMRAGSPAIPGLNKLAGEVVEVTLTLSLTFKVKGNRLLKW